MRAKNILVIDKTNLDEEWSLQPERYYEAAMDLAEAKGELAEAEDALELIEAKADVQFREDPAAFGFAKATDATAKSAVILDHRVQDAKKKVRNAKEVVAKLWAKVTALDHKKAGLGDMVSLDGRNYFARPKAPEGMSGEMQERERSRILSRRQ